MLRTGSQTNGITGEDVVATPWRPSLGGPRRRQPRQISAFLRSRACAWSPPSPSMPVTLALLTARPSCFMESGYMGVTLFFILPGFVLSLNYLDAFRHNSGRKLWQYAVARLARIYPLYILLVVYFIDRQRAFGESISGWWEHVLGEASYAFYLVHGPALAYLGGGRWPHRRLRGSDAWSDCLPCGWAARHDRAPRSALYTLSIRAPTAAGYRT
jgi:hypothetical protein